MSEVKEKQFFSMEDIEIGDIFYSSWGYDQTNIDFYKVIKKTAKMIEIREIGQVYMESNSSMSEYVVADPENELFKYDWVSPDKIEKGWEKVEVPWHENQIAQENGYIKVRTPAVSKHYPVFNNYSGSGSVSIKIGGYKYGQYWNGKKQFQSHWA
jgi:hypothetical protein